MLVVSVVTIVAMISRDASGLSCSFLGHCSTTTSYQLCLSSTWSCQSSSLARHHVADNKSVRRSSCASLDRNLSKYSDHPSHLAPHSQVRIVFARDRRRRLPCILLQFLNKCRLEGIKPFFNVSNLIGLRALTMIAFNNAYQRFYHL